MRHITSFQISSLALVVLLILAGCDDTQATEGEEEQREQSTTRVEVLSLERSYFEDRIEISGTVEALNDAILSAQASGTVTTMVERGQLIQAGQRVAQLNPREARAAVSQAEAQLESAQSQYELALDNFERQEPLYRDSVISPVEFETVRAELNQARSSVRQAEAQLEEAQNRLANTRVEAPFTGTVEERMVEQGEQVSPGTPIARIVSTQRVRVAAGVPERYSDDISEGTRVEVTIQGQPNRQIGRIVFVGSAINPQSRTFPIEVELSNPQRQLKPEMTARVFLTREEIEDALIVPRPAILRDERGTNVYVAVETDDGLIVENRSVTVGPQYGNEAVITSGLEPGDRVIVAGQNSVSPGDPVSVIERHEDLDTIDLPEPEEEG